MITYTIFLRQDWEICITAIILLMPKYSFQSSVQRLRRRGSQKTNSCFDTCFSRTSFQRPQLCAQIPYGHDVIYLPTLTHFREIALGMPFWHKSFWHNLRIFQKSLSWLLVWSKYVRSEKASSALCHYDHNCVLHLWGTHVCLTLRFICAGLSSRSLVWTPWLVNAWRSGWHCTSSVARLVITIANVKSIC